MVPTPRKGPFRKIRATALLTFLYFSIFIEIWRALRHSPEAPLAAVRFRERKKQTETDRERERESVLTLLPEADRG